MMRRTNTFTLNPGKEESAILNKWGNECARMYNEINYKRRQSFFSGKFDWNTDELYNSYKSHIGSATAQQIIMKNNDAWRSFFALLKLWKAGKIEKKPNPVFGYRANSILADWWYMTKQISELEAHRDAVGSVNIGLAHGIKNFHAGAINGAVARPSLLTIEA